MSDFPADWLTILPGDCREVLATLPAESINCVVTSPPYWGLRDYGTATWEGGREDCDHAQMRNVGSSTLRDDGRKNIGTQPYEKTAATVVPFRDTCGKCGARRIDSQLGLEPTPEEYVANLVDVFREVRRVLTKDGTVWLNLGDSYANDGKWGGSTGGKHVSALHGSPVGRGKRDTGMKPKDLVGIPWRVAFALQADGWWLRSDIIWAKPNPMPESVTDRPTRSHEYVFLLTKSARYFFDAEAVREDGAGHIWNSAKGFSPNGLRARLGVGTAGGEQWNGTGTHEDRNATGRNIRTVWTIATQPYPGAHFATFPEALVEPCIKAGCPIGGVVLDPFGGSGTTARVANRLSRRAVLIELNPDYIEQAEARNAQAPLGL